MPQNELISEFKLKRICPYAFGEFFGQILLAHTVYENKHDWTT